MSQVKGAPTPADEDDGVTELQERVLTLLEAANIPTKINDAVMRLIEAGERGFVAPYRFHVEKDAWGSFEVIDTAGRRQHSRWVVKADAVLEADRLNHANSGFKV